MLESYLWIPARIHLNSRFRCQEVYQDYAVLDTYSRVRGSSYVRKVGEWRVGVGNR